MVKNLKKYFMKSIAIPALLSISGCGDVKEPHRVSKTGSERGVAIDVILVSGGSARLICPKFNSMPLGSHGRECYLDGYDESVEQQIPSPQ